MRQRFYPHPIGGSGRDWTDQQAPASRRVRASSNRAPIRAKVANARPNASIESDVKPRSLAIRARIRSPNPTAYQ
jgi:hypothetical protein